MGTLSLPTLMIPQPELCAGGAPGTWPHFFPGVHGHYRKGCHPNHTELGKGGPDPSHRVLGTPSLCPQTSAAHSAFRGIQCLRKFVFRMAAMVLVGVGGRYPQHSQKGCPQPWSPSISELLGCSYLQAPGSEPLILSGYTAGLGIKKLNILIYFIITFG